MDVGVHKSLAEALKELSIADRLLLTANKDSIFDVVDRLRRAVQLSEGHDVEIVCMAYTKMALVFLKFIKEPGSQQKGKSYLNNVMAMSVALQQNKRNMHDLEWFRTASSLLQEMQDAAQKKEDQDWGNSRKQYVIELQEELELLGTYRNVDNRSLVTFLFERMPPKHRPESQWKHLLAEGENGWKKPLMKLLTIYHPDKVNNSDKSLHKYRVLCEEICKEIGKRYQQMKL